MIVILHFFAALVALLLATVAFSLVVVLWSDYKAFRSGRVDLRRDEPRPVRRRVLREDRPN